MVYLFNLSQTLKIIVTYIRIGYLLHAVSLIEIFLLCLLYSNDDFNNWLAGRSDFVFVCINLYLLSIPFFPQLDVRSRYQNYKMLRDQFYMYGFQPRIVKPFIKSRCQRDAALVAADDLGYAAVCKQHFYDHRYRWYHVLPDFLFSNPTFLLNRKFWETTFFAKCYKSRIDHNAVYDKKKSCLSAAA